MAFPFYNTAPPTPTTKNTINSVTVQYGIRDFLLNRNLLPVYPQISTSLNGSPRIGEPVIDTSVNNNSNVIPFGLPLETVGLTRYNLAILPNQFVNDDQNAPSLIYIENVPATQSLLFDNIDFPYGVESYPRTATDEITQVGLLGKTNYAGFRENSTLLNLYVDIDNQMDAADWITLTPIGVSNQLPGYLDAFGAINDGILGPLDPSDVLGDSLGSASISAGFNFSVGGLSIGVDFQAALSSRTLGSSSTINDTKLGFIASQELGILLSNNADFNTFSDYSITVPTNPVVTSLLNTILGYDVPTNYLTDAASIFSSENASGNIQRANSMLQNTGVGQFAALISNMTSSVNGTGQYDNPANSPFRTGYSPGFRDVKGKLAINPVLYAFYDDATSGTIYNFSTNPNNDAIPEINYNRSALIKKYGFLAPEDTFTGPLGNAGYDNRKISNVGFTWTSDIGGTLNNIPDYNILPTQPITSLLTKTQLLFKSKGMLNMVSVKGDMNKTSSQIETANGGGFSKGSAVISGSKFVNGILSDKSDTADNTYCRSWTTLDRYDNVSKLIRNSGLTQTAELIKTYSGGYRNEYQNSSLEDGGFVKIAPYFNDKYPDISNPDVPKNYTSLIKNYMFSIENLAWNESLQNLPPVEIGPGDKTNDIRGRIMWFPPYNIQFNETSSVSWESTNFIGRGEPVYTYNNTERSGNLSFSVIVDHPSYMNSFRGSNGPDDNYVASFFAGCVDIDSQFAKRLTVSEISAGSQQIPNNTQQAAITPETPPDNLTIYFPNDVYTLNLIQGGYENGLDPSQTPIDRSTNVSGQGDGIGSYSGELTLTPNTGYTDNFNFGLNAENFILDGKKYSGFNDTNYWSDLTTYLTTKCPTCVVSIAGYASPQGVPSVNVTLAQNRAQSIYNYFKDNVFGGKTDRLKPVISPPLADAGCVGQSGAQTDTIGCKKDRKVTVSFASDPTLAQKAVAPAQPITNTVSSNSQIASTITNRFYNEASYFQKLTSLDKFVFDDIRNKIKYFHPAFHSMTPEGLNSRLTFLQQCTRQGPTSNSKDAANLAFGRPPICILRIGDFYHTKIVIDNINIDYEPLVWDLNPEGVGVQPMIANVNMSFKFIGASTLLGPINKLQNALSFNYYANTHVYDYRADYIAHNTSAPTKVSGDLSNLTVTAGYWGIFEGATAYTYSTSNSSSQTTNSVNQPAAATQAQTLTNPSAAPTSNPNTKPDLDRVSITAQKDGTMLVVTFKVEGTTDLTKDYDYSVVVTDNNTVNSIVGVGTLKSTSLNETYVNFDLADSSGNLQYGLVEGNTYFIIVKFSGKSCTTNFVCNN